MTKKRQGNPWAIVRQCIKDEGSDDRAAERIGVSHAMVRVVKRGGVPSTYRIRERFSAALGIPADAWERFSPGKLA